MNDERKGKPSASGLHRIALCPGSLQAERGLPDNPTDDAALGTLIHRWLAGEAVTLDPEAEETAEIAKRQAEKVIADFEAAHGPSQPFALDDLRLWSAGEEFSGLADVLRVAEDGWFLAIDYKTGHNPVEPAESNWQMAGLAVLVADNYDPPGVRVAIVQPWVAGPPSICDYESDHFIIYSGQISSLIKSAKMQDATRTPHPDACKYCRANGTPRCPESSAAMASLAPIATDQSVTDTYTDDELFALYLSACQAEQCAAVIKTRVKSAVRDGRVIGDLILKESDGVRKISDAGKVAERLMEKGAETPEIVAACSMTLKDLEALCRKRWALKGQALKGFVDETLVDAVTLKKGEPRLERSRK